MNADFILLHVPLTKSGEDATFHLFDEARLKKMKRGSILINSSRGAVVDGDALKRNLQSNHLRSCVLDVWEREPNIDVELLQLVALGSPHIAGYSYDGKLNATTMLQQAIADAFHLSISKITQTSSVELKELSLPETPDTSGKLLHHLVKQCYDICEDDRNLRALVNLAPNERGEQFRKLRAQYRTRREFQNYVVDGTQLDEESQVVLSAVGFKVKTLKDAA
jgi:erythronate-4-phosphate dehydrogenase